LTVCGFGVSTWVLEFFLYLYDDTIGILMEILIYV
jgi:hypothetical protein